MDDIDNGFNKKATKLRAEQFTTALADTETKIRQLTSVIAKLGEVGFPEEFLQLFPTDIIPLLKDSLETKLQSCKAAIPHIREELAYEKAGLRSYQLLEAKGLRNFKELAGHPEWHTEMLRGERQIAGPLHGVYEIEYAPSYNPPWWTERTGIYFRLCGFFDKEMEAKERAIELNIETGKQHMVEVALPGVREFGWACRLDEKGEWLERLRPYFERQLAGREIIIKIAAESEERQKQAMLWLHYQLGGDIKWLKRYPGYARDGKWYATGRLDVPIELDVSDASQLGLVTEEEANPDE